ncbi:MAG: DNA polymerase IV, partial [Christensenellales bacterium]
SFEQGVAKAEEIRKTIEKELGVTISVGVSYNKIFAKLGSDLKKPNAVVPLPPESLSSVIWPLSPRALLYVGPVTEKKLARIGINTIGALASAPALTLRSLLGKWGDTLQQYAQGHEYSSVAKWGDTPLVKSIGNSTTLPKNITCREQLVPVIYMLCECNRAPSLKHMKAVLHLWLRTADLPGKFGKSAGFAYPGQPTPGRRVFSIGCAALA